MCKFNFNFLVNQLLRPTKTKKNTTTTVKHNTKTN
jgi:hypothetical protein